MGSLGYDPEVLDQIFFWGAGIGIAVLLLDIARDILINKRKQPKD